MRRHETVHLFYNKYLYKLVLHNRLGYFFRNKNLSIARKVLDDLQREYEQGNPLVIKRILRQDQVKEDDFVDAKKILKHLTRKKDYMLRIESSTMCIYSNDKKWLDEIVSDINVYNLEEMWEPNIDSVTLLETNTILVANSNGYEYRVTLGSKKGNPDFARWAEKNPKQIRMGLRLREHMCSKDYVENMYFYARDEKTLQLCSLMLDNIRRIDKLVVKQDIDK